MKMTLTGVFLLLPLSFASAQTLSTAEPTFQGVLETTVGNYEITPGPCAIYIEDGTLDIEINGLGTAPDGQSFYFSLSSLGNELGLQLGVDRPFQTSEQQLKAGQYVSQPFVVEASDGVISIASLTLVDEVGETIDSDASLRIDCNPGQNEEFEK